MVQLNCLYVLVYRTAYQQTVCEQKAGEPGAYIGDMAFVIFYFAITGAWFLYYINGEFNCIVKYCCYRKRNVIRYL